MIKNLCSLFFSLFGFSILLAQSLVTGFTTNNDGKYLRNVSIVVKNTSGNIISYTTTDDNGKYDISVTKFGEFEIIASSLGYVRCSKIITILDSKETKQLNFILTQNSTEIEEVIVKSVSPIQIKKDTIVFEAKSFAKPGDKVVEDLLKRIPGLNIDSKGVVKIGGKEVEKIMVDGEDMFQKGYQLLTKNMPSASIEKVELYQNYSNNKHFKGVENSDKVALNLSLSEIVQNNWFGNFNLGYGLFSKNRYDTKTNFINFSKKTKHYFFTNFNNTGNDSFDGVYQLINSIESNGSLNSDITQTAGSLLNFDFVLPNFKQKRINLNNSELLCLNSIYTLSDKIKIKTLGVFSKDELGYYNKNLQAFSFSDLSFVNTEVVNSQKKIGSGFGKLDLIYDISKKSTVDYVVKFNSFKGNYVSNLLFNENLINENFNSKQQLLDQKISFTHKFKLNNVFQISYRFINEKVPQNYYSNPYASTILFLGNTMFSKQFSENNMKFSDFNTRFLTKTKKGNLLEFKFGNHFRIDKFISRFELAQNQTNIILPVNFQNNNTLTTNDVFLLFNYQLKLKAFTVTTQADLHNINNCLNENRFSSNYLVPKIGLDWKINNKNTISSYYNYKITNTGVFDIYSGYVQTDYRSFSKGLGSFNQLNSSVVNLNYKYGNWGDKFFVNSIIRYTKNNTYYGYNSIINANTVQSDKIIVKGQDLLSISIDFDRFFKSIKSTLKLNLTAVTNEYKNSINNSDLRDVKSRFNSVGFELCSVFRGFFNYNFGSKLDYSVVKTSQTSISKNNLTFLDLSFVFSNKFNVKIQTERYSFGNLDKNNKNYYFLDLETNYLIKSKNITFSLSGNNLLNTKTFINYSINDVSSSITEYKLQSRYLLLRIEYRF